MYHHKHSTIAQILRTIKLHFHNQNKSSRKINETKKRKRFAQKKKRNASKLIAERGLYTQEGQRKEGAKEETKEDYAKKKRRKKVAPGNRREGGGRSG